MTRSADSTRPPPSATARVRRPLAPIAVVGVLAGFLAGLFGVGGGILIVPGLVLAAHMSQRLAHGTSLAAVVPISIASLISYAAHDNVDWNVALWLAVGAVGGAVIGTRCSTCSPSARSAIMFIVVLVASALRLFLATDADGRGELTAVARWSRWSCVGLVTGILAGLLGVGGGIVMVPAMILLFDIEPVVAKGTSAAVIIAAAIMGTWRNRANDNTDLRAAAVIGDAGHRHGGDRRHARRPDERRPVQRAVRDAAADRRRPACSGSLRRDPRTPRVDVNLAEYLIAFAAVVAGAIAQGRGVRLRHARRAGPGPRRRGARPGAVLLLGLTVAARRVARTWRARLAGHQVGHRRPGVRHPRRRLRGEPVRPRRALRSSSGRSCWSRWLSLSGCASGRRGTLVGAGTMSGLMGTLTSVGGPPMALVYQREQAATLRSTLAGFFLFGATWSLITLAVTGEVGSASSSTASSCCPASSSGWSPAGSWRPRRPGLDPRRRARPVDGRRPTALVVGAPHLKRRGR